MCSLFRLWANFVKDGESIKAMGIDTDLRWLPFIAKATPPSQIPPATGRQGLLYCASLNPIAAAAVEFLVEEVIKKCMRIIIVNLCFLQHSTWCRLARQLSKAQLSFNCGFWMAPLHTGSAAPACRTSTPGDCRSILARKPAEFAQVAGVSVPRVHRSSQ